MHSLGCKCRISNLHGGLAEQWSNDYKFRTPLSLSLGRSRHLLWRVYMYDVRTDLSVYRRGEGGGQKVPQICGQTV